MMKNLIPALILLLSLFLCVFFVGCGSNDDETAETTAPNAETTVAETDLISSVIDVTSIVDTDPNTAKESETTTSQDTEDKLWEEIKDVIADPIQELQDSLDKKHTYGWLESIQYDFLKNMVGREAFSEYVSMMTGADENLGAFVDYFCINREMYARAAEQEYEWLVENFYDDSWSLEAWFFLNYPFLRDYDAWFSDDYENHPIFLIRLYEPPATASVRIRCETDETHTNRYYTIDYRLIDYVTPAAFEEFRTQFGGTEDFNILHFIEYFEIDREEYCSLYTDIPLALPYNPDYLYGNEEMQEKYFCRHPAYLWS